MKLTQAWILFFVFSAGHRRRCIPSVFCDSFSHTSWSECLQTSLTEALLCTACKLEGKNVTVGNIGSLHRASHLNKYFIINSSVITSNFIRNTFVSKIKNAITNTVKTTLRNYTSLFHASRQVSATKLLP